MKWTLFAGLAAALLALAAPPIDATAAAEQPANPASVARRFTVPADAEQLVVVSSPTYSPPDYLATLRAYQRPGRSASWREVFGPWRAETGYGHLRDVRREGDGSTPTGVFAFGATMYGNRPNPGALHYPYHRLVCGDWWDEDPYSPAYNHFVHVPCGTTPAFAAWSEALWTETVAYPYFAVIDFNMHPIVAGADAPGSGIFLHSWVGGPTEGCVALPETKLLEVLRWLVPADHPVIDIGTEREVGVIPVSPAPAGSGAP